MGSTLGNVTVKKSQPSRGKHRARRMSRPVTHAGHPEEVGDGNLDVHATRHPPHLWLSEDRRAVVGSAEPADFHLRDGASDHAQNGVRIRWVPWSQVAENHVASTCQGTHRYGSGNRRAIFSETEEDIKQPKGRRNARVPAGNTGYSSPAGEHAE